MDEKYEDVEADTVRDKKYNDVHESTFYTVNTSKQAGQAEQAVPAVPARDPAAGRRRSATRWDDPDGALQKYLDQKDDLRAGRTPRPTNGELTVRDLCNRFMTSKKLLLDSGEITQRPWADYYASCERIVDSSGKNRLVSNVAVDDFERFKFVRASASGDDRLKTVADYAGLVIRHAEETK